eukprot:TRINITY_DN41333_c0_g1_i1.p1 TRINITY_DN41333_c0_g1~~TRINITY_DN41333_c0_g1_i1.p1  ORF type:complete len:259 (-),score=45.16 TRINITY_DN41333_c0_g1_i1:155-829(-)
MTFKGLSTPVLQVLGDPRNEESLKDATSLLEALIAKSLLPKSSSGDFECWLNAGLEKLLIEAGYSVSAKLYHRMALETSKLTARSSSDSKVRHLIMDDAVAAAALCATMPRSWFEAKQLDEGKYFALAHPDDDNLGLVSIAGTHVYAPKYGVAALGNVCTHPDFRGKGFSKAVVGELCRHLHSEGVSMIALNVETDNEAAIRLYKSLGFTIIMDFVECDVKLKS